MTQVVERLSTKGAISPEGQKLKFIYFVKKFCSFERDGCPELNSIAIVFFLEFSSSPGRIKSPEGQKVANIKVFPILVRTCLQGTNILNLFFNGFGNVF